MEVGTFLMLLAQVLAVPDTAASQSLANAQRAETAAEAAAERAYSLTEDTSGLVFTPPTES